MQLMDHSQVKQYIKRHLEYAGMDHEVFSDEASEAIYRYSGGSARLVNKACTSTLIFGCQSGKRIIDDHMVKLVINGELS
jgi:type II secretory pathway predicted ATPase ExeA